jgi:hypothetical protein
MLSSSPSPSAPLGVVIVTFDAANVILDCLGTLTTAAAQDVVPLRIAVVDNASTDGTADLVSGWMEGRQPWTPPADLPFPPSAAVPDVRTFLLLNPVNGGFAAGVNLGLAQLAKDPAITRFWVLNPDSLVPPGTPGAFARHDPGPFALMGGRVTYTDPPDLIQIDGGTLDRRTGVTGNLNLGCRFAEAPVPSATDMAFITGASLVASRDFLDRAGPMPEDYFLYYEEVDWAMRRGDLPLAFCPAARVFHRGGTAIGSPTFARLASPFSLYFKHRARMRFVRRHLPASLTAAWVYSLAKAGQYLLKGYGAGAAAIWAGARDAPLPAAVRHRLGPAAAVRAAR